MSVAVEVNLTHCTIINTGINSIRCLEEKKKERSFSSGAPLVLTDDDGMCLPI